MRQQISCLVFAGLLMGGLPARAEICTVDDVPAATLLLPYFEVDLGNPNGVNTLFSINNASARAALAHVTLWTDQSIPTLNFDVYLTGYDVQTLSLRNLFAGNLPVTADAGADPGDAVSHKGRISQDTDFPGDLAPCSAPYANPVLDNFRVTNLAAAHMGRNAPAYGRCLGAYHDDNIARGYVTVDSITRCNLLFPSSANYFAGGVADNRNILWGDYFYVNPSQSFAQGETLVHIEACNAPAVGTGDGRCPFAAGRYTFYGRYASIAGQDQREPLATAFATRFIQGGVFNGGTDLIVWRDSKTLPTSLDGPYTCGLAHRPSWFPLGQSDVVAFDEQENPEDLCFTGDVVIPIGDSVTCFPLEAQRVSLAGGNVIGADPAPSWPSGWLYLNLNASGGVDYPAPNPRVAQAWVTTVMDADGRFSVGYDAIQLDSACAPSTAVFIP
ncbi:MAG TPA: hypothetical protein VHC97_13005 [Thermoanaerobaculia bacterium]|jgi:hypothetical protein|nr:hypothetical protein [Thermoanaerobaculia bacterium]